MKLWLTVVLRAPLAVGDDYRVETHRHRPEPGADVNALHDALVGHLTATADPEECPVFCLLLKVPLECPACEARTRQPYPAALRPSPN